MKQPNQVLLIAGLLGLLALPGCYTQLSTTRTEREPADRDYTASESDTSAVVAEDQEGYERYDNDSYDQYADNWRPRVGFNYYYPSTYWPSTAFTVSYANPWAYDCYWSYDPWICGTPYVHYPYYGYGYYPSYFYPSYPYGYSYGYTYGSRNVRHGSREFGETRGSTGNRGTDRPVYQPTTSGGSDLPRGSRVVSPQGAPAAPRSAPAVKETGRTSGSARGAYVPRSDGRSTGRSPEPGMRGASPRGGSTRGDGRAAQPRYRTPQAPSTPPAGSPPPSRDAGGSRSTPTYTPPPSRDAGGSRSTPTYTPPPVRSAPPPAPAPAPSSGGGRGGDTRGRRP